MKKIKLFELHGEYQNEYEDFIVSNLSKQLTEEDEWIEVSDKEFVNLRDFLWTNRFEYSNREKFSNILMIAKCEHQEVKDSIIDKLREEAAKEEERKRKSEERKKKAAETRRKNKIKKEKEQLEKLKQKYEDESN